MSICADGHHRDIGWAGRWFCSSLSFVGQVARRAASLFRGLSADTDRMTRRQLRDIGYRRDEDTCKIYRETEF